MNRKALDHIWILLLFTFSVGFLFYGCQSKDEKNPPVEKEDPIINEGNAALISGDWTKAIDAFSAGIEKDSGKIDYYYGRSAARLARGKDAYLLARAAAGANEMEKAEMEVKRSDEDLQFASDDARKILELDPDNADARYLLGCVALYQADWENAIDLFSEVIRLQPENPYAYQRRGEVYGYIYDWENESADLTKAAELGYSSSFDEETIVEEDFDVTGEGNAPDDSLEEAVSGGESEFVENGTGNAPSEEGEVVESDQTTSGNAKTETDETE